MTNNLRVLKKDLKSFAKRVKDFKYTESALITFLLTGLIELTGTSFNLFSAENEIQAQTKAINTSITNLKSDFRFARHENDKLLRKTNLELVKLMEQGDHVVKSPWSSWQYGINGFYNSWQGSYKGRGDKTADYKYERDKTMSKTKYEAYPHTLYGNTTELGLKQEPNASIPVSASLTPLIPKVKYANVSMAVDISELPSFTPRTVNPPEKPNIDTTVNVEAPTFSLVGESLANNPDEYFDYNDNYHPVGTPAYQGIGVAHGIIEGVSLISGNFATELTGVDTGRNSAYSGNQYRSSGYWTYGYNNYVVYNPMSVAVRSNNNNFLSNPTASVGPGMLSTSFSRNTTTTVYPKTGFLRMTSHVYPNKKSSTMVNNANIMYTKQSSFNNNVGIKEIVHLDTHGAQPLTDEDGRVATIVSHLGSKGAEVTAAWNDFRSIANEKNLTHSQTFINSGTVVVEGEKVAFSNSYDHTNGTDNAKWTATVINTGDIVIHPMKKTDNGILDSKAAVFVVSPEVYAKGNDGTGINGIAQILYNSGKINVYNKNSAIFFINPDPFERTINTTARRDVTIVNRKGEIKEYGDSSVGVYIKTPNYVRQLNLDFSDSQASAGNFNPLTLYGDHNIGLYIEKVTNDTSDKRSDTC